MWGFEGWTPPFGFGGFESDSEAGGSFGLEALQFRA